ncbi:MAG: hypothetical protein V7K20_02360 [Nostoc sp.]
MPTHPAGPEMRQDPIRFKNLVKEAETRLIDAGLEQKEAIVLLEKSHEIDTQEFWEQMAKQGLAIFISENIFRYYTLPIDFQELVVVTDRFQIKPLLPILNGNGQQFHFYSEYYDHLQYQSQSLHIRQHVKLFQQPNQSFLRCQ